MNRVRKVMQLLFKKLYLFFIETKNQEKMDFPKNNVK